MVDNSKNIYKRNNKKKKKKINKNQTSNNIYFQNLDKLVRLFKL